MSIAPLKTAAEAFAEAFHLTRRYSVNVHQSDFVCPYSDCRVYAAHHWGMMSSVTTTVGETHYQGREIKGSRITVSLCQSCGRDVVFLDQQMVRPSTSEAPAPAADMPAAILGEYAEAAAILPNSPRGAAALLRLAVQKLLPELGATEKNIDKQIGELVATRVVSGRVKEALDTLRVIGNEAVHPGTIDLTDDVETAMGLFRLLNFIVEKAITEPAHAEQMFASLPDAKKAAIDRRDGAQSQPSAAIDPRSKDN